MYTCVSDRETRISTALNTSSPHSSNSFFPLSLFPPSFPPIYVDPSQNLARGSEAVLQATHLTLCARDKRQSRLARLHESNWLNFWILIRTLYATIWCLQPEIENRQQCFRWAKCITKSSNVLKTVTNSGVFRILVRGHHLHRHPAQIWQGTKINAMFKILVWELGAMLISNLLGLQQEQSASSDEGALSDLCKTLCKPVLAPY